MMAFLKGAVVGFILVSALPALAVVGLALVRSVLEDL